ncbi:MAG TPA: ABC transporter permease [Nitrososphaerales archaeon]|nr:ABC transporter permease [Nitrososphaerales archaeon]
MNLLRFALRRLLFAVFVLFGVLTITFVLSHLLGGNVLQAWFGKEYVLHPNLVALYQKTYHLNDPIWVQFVYYFVGILRGNLGFSPSRGFEPVSQVIEQTLPYTLQVVLTAFVVCVVIGLALGIVSARYYKSPVDRFIRVFYIGAYSSPPYFIGVVVLIIFAYYFRILPSGGYYNPAIANQPTVITGLPIVDSLVEGNWAYFASAARYLILPSLALALATFGIITRVARSALLDVMQMDYIRTARAKGLEEGKLFSRHALPNAAVSLITISSLVMTFLITGSIFVEIIFSYPGIGPYLQLALQNEDYPGIIGVTLVFAAIIVTTNFLADVLYAYADPQIRLG